MRGLLFLLVSFLWVSVQAPALAAPTSPLDFLETLDGPAKAHTQGTWVYVTFGEPSAQRERVFRIDAADLKGPLTFQTAASKVLYWDGHLILLDQQSTKAWHFWIPGADERNKGVAGARPEAEGLKALLADYEVTRVEADEISSHSWPKGLRPGRPDSPAHAPQILYEPENPDPGGSGVGSCGTKCSITCGDGSSCQTSCSGRRCATCACPASCSCS
ncbi:MAG TPA: hypothetical protein VHN15_04830 [Thermoanaerobaculia bacterium]|nr:hypothetical protein [Thermoanaerobaculia bacterium]